MMLVTLLLILLAVLGLYFVGMSRVAKELTRAQQWAYLASFSLGLLVALPVFIPAPDFFGPDHRFLVSMGQMMIAVDLAPVLLYLGLPPVLLQPLLRWPRLGGWLRKPQLAGIASTALLLVWFLPAFFGAASGNLAIWLFKQVLFLLSGLLFWWPTAGPLPGWRPSYPIQFIYLMVMRVPMAALGIAFTFSGNLIYLARSFALEICAPASVTDQQNGGLLIMFAGGMVLFIALAIVFNRWADQDAKETKKV